MKALRIEGTPGAEPEITTLNTLRKLYPHKKFLHDYMLLLDRESYAPTVVMALTYDDAKVVEQSIIHRPDIVALDANNRIAYIVEIDGSIHDTRSGRRKTEKRDADYHAAGIPCIVVQAADTTSVAFGEWLYKRVEAIIHA